MLNATKNHQVKIRRTSAKRSPAGFTLIELMVVVALIGIGTAIAAPDIKTALDRQRASAAEREVEEAVMRARNFARLTLCEVDVTVVADTDGRWILSYETSETNASLPCYVAGDPDGLAKITTSVKFSRYITLSGFSVAGAPQPVFKFNRRGGTDYPAEGRLTVTTTVGTARLLEIWPAIGTIKVII